MVFAISVCLPFVRELFQVYAASPSVRLSRPDRSGLISGAQASLDAFLLSPTVIAHSDRPLRALPPAFKFTVTCCCNRDVHVSNQSVRLIRPDRIGLKDTHLQHRRAHSHAFATKDTHHAICVICGGHNVQRLLYTAQCLIF